MFMNINNMHLFVSKNVFLFIIYLKRKLSCICVVCWDKILVQVPLAFQKLLHFYENPPVAPRFANQKKSEEDFHFYEKRWNTAKIACFASPYTSSTQPVHREWRQQVPCPRDCSQREPPQLWTVSVSICALHLNLFCAPVSKMWYQVNLRDYFSVRDYSNKISI